MIFGSTGMVGSGVLLECLDEDKVDKIFLVNRRPSGVSSEKVEEIICEDLFQLSTLNSSFKEKIMKTNACFLCLGVSAAGMSEEKYAHLTYDLTISIAEYLKSINSNIVVTYISGLGTDSSEKGRVMWARVKGKTENALLNMGFRDAYMFRPGFIQPMKGVKSKTLLYRFFYFLFRPLYFFLKYFESSVTSSPEFGRAMINVALHGYDKKILENKDIIQVAKNHKW